MQYKGMNLCDFCFSEMNSENICTNCGITHDTYHIDAGLLPPGTNILGKYIIGRVLGRGGFGATYLAYSSVLDKPVAIKEYMPVSITYRGKGEENVTIVNEEKKNTFDKGAKRFFEEAKTISHFNRNKNIVSVYEFFNANDTVYYAMEYLSGCDLKKYIAKNGGRLSEKETLDVTKAVCNALMVVHSTQTLHRDISPDNIFMCSNGDIKLIDFGAAKQVVSNEDKSYSVVVKQGFAPSEQYSSKGNQGVWTDIYALGATAYYALTGKVPADAIDRVDNPELELDKSLKHYNEFSYIINKCMQPRAADRYQSVVELMGDLDRLEIVEDEKPKVEKKAKAETSNEKNEDEDVTIPMEENFSNNPFAKTTMHEASGQKKPLSKKIIISIAASFLGVCIATGITIGFINSTKTENGIESSGPSNVAENNTDAQKDVQALETEAQAKAEAEKKKAEEEAKAEAEKEIEERENQEAKQESTQKQTTTQKKKTSSTQKKTTQSTQQQQPQQQQQQPQQSQPQPQPQPQPAQQQPAQQQPTNIDLGQRNDAAPEVNINF